MSLARTIDVDAAAKLCRAPTSRHCSGAEYRDAAVRRCDGLRGRWLSRAHRAMAGRGLRRRRPLRTTAAAAARAYSRGSRGPGNCDNWCVGPHWNVEVDGMIHPPRRRRLGRHRRRRRASRRSDRPVRLRPRRAAVRHRLQRRQLRPAGRLRRRERFPRQRAVSDRGARHAAVRLPVDAQLARAELHPPHRLPWRAVRRRAVHRAGRRLHRLRPTVNKPFRRRRCPRRSTAFVDAGRRCFSGKPADRLSGRRASATRGG